MYRIDFGVEHLPTRICHLVFALVFVLAMTVGVRAQEAEAEDLVDAVAEVDPGEASEAATNDESDGPVLTARGEIVVVAQRREQAIQDVGIAITALTADELYDSGTRNTQAPASRHRARRLAGWT